MSPRDPVPAPQGRSSPSPPRPPPAESANQLPQGLSACQGCLGTFLKFPIGFTEVNNHFKKRQLANILDLCPVTDSLSSTSQDQMVTITRLFRAHLLRASREPKTCRNEWPNEPEPPPGQSLFRRRRSHQVTRTQGSGHHGEGTGAVGHRRDPRPAPQGREQAVAADGAGRGPGRRHMRDT